MEDLGGEKLGREEFMFLWVEEKNMKCINFLYRSISMDHLRLARRLFQDNMKQFKWTGWLRWVGGLSIHIFMTHCIFVVYNYHISLCKDGWMMPSQYRQLIINLTCSSSPLELPIHPSIHPTNHIQLYIAWNIDILKYWAPHPSNQSYTLHEIFIYSSCSTVCILSESHQVSSSSCKSHVVTNGGEINWI